MSTRDLGIVRETSSAILQHSESGFELDQVNHYVFVGKLGEGASGEVFEVMDEYTKDRFAIKCFPSKSILRRRGVETKRVGRKMTEVGNAFEDVLKEIAIMKRIRHPNLVKLVEIIDDAQIDRLFMILELVEGGTVMEWNVSTKRFIPNALLCENAESTTLSTKFSQRVMRDCIRGLDYLHESKVMHRDLKPQNLLLDRHTMRVKIADFGTSLAIEHVTDGMLQSTKGTFPFYAPECCSTGQATLFDGYKADVWSLGVCLFCFLTGTLPFYDADPTVLFESIRTAPIPFDRLPTTILQDGVDLVKLLLERDVLLRPATACKLMDMESIPWLGRIYRDMEASTRNIADVSEKEIHEALSTVLRVAGFAKMWRRRTIANLQQKRSALKFTLSSSDLLVSGADGAMEQGNTTPKATVHHGYSKSDQSVYEFNNTSSARSLLSRSSLDSSTRSLSAVELKPDSQRKLNLDDLDNTLAPTLSRLSAHLLLQPVQEEITDDLQRVGGSNGVLLAAPIVDAKHNSHPPLLKRRSSRSLKRGVVESRSFSNANDGPPLVTSSAEKRQTSTKKSKKDNTATCCTIS